MNRKPQIVISCHSDTGFRSHSLSRTGDSYVGHLDNFAGVHAVMNAFFSGRMTSESLRIELTYGEETDMEGARRVQATLSPDDVVVVVDVTGTETTRDITIEKCKSPRMRHFVNTALEGMSFALYEGCPDPVADEDESDVYAEKLENVFFLGIPCTGGDYNGGIVSSRQESIRAASEAIVRLVEQFISENNARPSSPAGVEKLAGQPECSMQKLIQALGILREHIRHARGHAHLYAEFDRILVDLAGYRDRSGAMAAPLAHEVLMSVDLLVQESMVHGQSLTGGWEMYIWQCMEDALRLLKVFATFKDSATFRPAGYCNRILDAFTYMDLHSQKCAEQDQNSRSKLFAHLTTRTAEMFSLVADNTARIDENLLEHPDDAVFTWLLTGYARSQTPEAHKLLQGYLKDDEFWVIQLAEELMDRYFAARPSSGGAAKGHAISPGNRLMR